MTIDGGFLVKIGAAKSKAKLRDHLISLLCVQLTQTLDIFDIFHCNEIPLRSVRILGLHVADIVSTLGQLIHLAFQITNPLESLLVLLALKRWVGMKNVWRHATARRLSL